MVRLGDKSGKELLWGVKNTPRAVKELYVGVRGVPKLVYAAAFAFLFEPDNGLADQCVVVGDLAGDFCLCFLSSGTLTIQSLGKAAGGVELWALAAGEDGRRGSTHSWRSGTTWYYHRNGGDGGHGGAHTLAEAKLTAKSYRVVVDTDGQGSAFGELCTAVGYDKAGGVHIESASAQAAARGDDGVCAFDDPGQATIRPAGYRFGAGGGAGYGFYYYEAGGHGSPYVRHEASAGGQDGGPAGGSGTEKPGADAESNTGTGGSGTGCPSSMTNGATAQAAPGKGGSGLVCLRNARR